MHTGRGFGPANIAVVMLSGVSVVSAVTATSFQEGKFSHATNYDERNDDGDIEDKDGNDSNDDGSASRKYTPSYNLTFSTKVIFTHGNVLSQLQLQEIEFPTWIPSSSVPSQEAMIRTFPDAQYVATPAQVC